MKKIIITIAIAAAQLAAAAATDKDTVSIDMNKIERIVKNETTTAKGKPTVKYYSIVGGTLVTTSKTVAEKIELCKKFHAKCALSAVRNRKTKAVIRIILD